MTISLPLTGRPKQVIFKLKKFIEEIDDDDDVDTYYLGRTNDPEARQSEHGANELVELYQTDSVDNAIEVEEAIIQIFIGHDKCDNEADHGGGGVSDDPPQFVYVALWFAE